MFVIFENGLSIHWFMKGNVHKLYKSLKAAWNELSGLFKRLWVHGGLSELNISESTLHIFHQNRIFLIFAERCADLEHFLLLSCCCLCDIQRMQIFSFSLRYVPTICNRVKRLTGPFRLEFPWLNFMRRRNLMKFNIFVPSSFSD